ncbi:DUF2884 family protein [Ferrimonas pelagia]|uniref:DUF2884 family protein n=1 Tax=Ferrimonas pelagia TaxID=1177826 RepID=A0ABP9ECK7_9GAMM
MLRTVFASILLLASTVSAQEWGLSVDRCDLTINHGIEVDHARLLISDNDKTLYRFEDDRLWVEGEEVRLDREQRLALQSYQLQLLNNAEQLVGVVDEALGLAGTALDEVFGELAGLGIENESMGQLMSSVQQHIQSSMVTERGGYRLNSDSIDNVGDKIDDAVSKEVEQAITASMGNMLVIIGQAMAGGEGSFEQRMESFGQSMEQMGQRLEAKVEAQASQIEAKAERMCDEWKALGELEADVQRLIPQLNAFDVIVHGDPDLAWLR